MNHLHSANDQKPITWLHGHAIYAAHFVVLLFVASMLATTVLMAASAESILGWLPFNSTDVWHGQAWRVVTCGLLNPPSLWFVVDMFMIVWFGRELEKFFGRRKFLFFFGSLYLLSPLLFTVIGFWQPMALAGETGAFAVFIAFAVLYPGAIIFFNLPARWIAAILVGIYTLMALSDRNPVSLITLWTTVGFAITFVRYEQGRIAFPRFMSFHRRPKFRVLSNREPAPEDASMTEIDPLLDKIARSGMESLTPKERTRLESVRAELLKRKSRRADR